MWRARLSRYHAIHSLGRSGLQGFLRMSPAYSNQSIVWFT